MKGLLFVLFVSVVLPACEKPAGENSIAADVVAEAHAETPEQPKTNALVSVSAEGTKFEPSVTPEQMPDGAWMCLMGGKVHYARTEEGNKKCAVCGMALQQAHGAHEAGHRH